MAVFIAFFGLILIASQSNYQIEFAEHFADRLDEKEIDMLFMASVITVYGFLIFKVYLLLVIYSLYAELRSKYPMTQTAPPLQNVTVINDNQIKFFNN